MEYRPHDDNGMRELLVVHPPSNNLLKDREAAASASDDEKNDAATDSDNDGDDDDVLTSLLLVIDSTHGSHTNTSNEDCTTNTTTANTTVTTYNDDHDHDHAYNRHTRHIEDAVIREEQCIELLQSYLSTQRDSSTTEEAAATVTLPVVHQTATPSATQQDCERDHLRDMFQSILPALPRTNYTSCTNDTTLPPLHQQLPLQPPLRSTTHPSALVRNFCLTSVQYRNQTNRDKVKSHHKYNLRGYFTVNPSVQLSIEIVTTNHCHHHPIDTLDATGTDTTTTTTTTKCTLLFHGHSDTITTEKEEWCHWLQQQILPVVQETCGDGYPCSFLLVDHHDARDDDDDATRDNFSNRHHHHHQRRNGTIASDSPYFLSAYITCIHEYLQFDHSRRTFLKQPSAHHHHDNRNNGHHKATDCQCGAINGDNDNHYRPCTMTHLPDHQSTLICIPIYPQQQQQSAHSQQTAKVEPYQRYKRYIIMDDDDDDDDDDGNHNNVPNPANRPEPPCRILSLICSWRFKDRKCSLRLQNSVTHDYHHITTSRNGGIGNHHGDPTKRLRQSDLDQLVMFCHNNVWQTLTLLRNYCSACTCWKDTILPLPRTVPSKSVRPKQPKIHHSVPTLVPSKKRKRSKLRHDDHMNLHDIDADADDEGDWEDYDEGMEEDDNYDSDILRKDKRRLIASDRRNHHHQQQQPQQQPQQQGYESTNDQQSVNVFDEQPEDNLEASFRLSPSGRQRSDYEVERLMRIKRNERKLSQLGLLIPNHLPHRGGGGGGDEPVTKVTKRKRRSRSRKISVPLSPYRPPPARQNYFSEPRIYPKRQGNNDDLRLPLNSWMLSSTPSLQPRRKLPIARPKQSQHSSTPTTKAMATTPNGYQRSMDHPNCLLPKFPPILVDADSVSAIQYRRPRGIAPGGYKWHPSTGLWVPIDDPMYDHGHFSNGIKDSKQNAGTPSEKPDFSSTQNSAAKIDAINMNHSLPQNSNSTEPTTFKGFRVIEDGCLLPKKTLKLNVDGVTFRRPHGQAPAGFDWDLVRGVWTPIGDHGSVNMESSRQKQNDAGTSNVEPDFTSTQNSAANIEMNEFFPRNSDSTETMTFKGFRVIEDGCLLPKKTLKLNGDGVTYRRPHGKAPAGYDWDSIRGIWTPIGDSIPVLSKTPKVSDNHRGDDADLLHIDQSKIKEVVDSIHTNRAVSRPSKTFKGFQVLSDGCLQPKKELKLDKDNSSYRRPQGASPEGFDWDSIRGVWAPNNGTATPKVTDFVANDVVVRESGPSTIVDGVNFTGDLIETYSGFLVLSDGCLLPKKELTLGKDGTSYRRPHGASPAGFDWDPIRGVWKPIDEHAPLPNKKTTSKPTPATTAAGDNQASSNSNEIRLKRLLRNGFVVDGDGSILPKTGPATDPENPLLYKRPRGASPGKYKWNPTRGVWEPTVTQVKKQTDVQRDVAHGREPGAPLQKITKRSKPKKTWKGFRVLKDNCLAPKKELKPETNRYNNKQILWRRPHGAAPSGYDWNNIRGVWVPLITVTAVGNDASELIEQETTATTASLPKGEELSKNDESKQNTSDNQIEAIVAFEDYYPKRKRIRLERYAPPS